MTGAANFPTALDDNTSLYDVIDGSTTVIAAHHNNIKEAVKAIEEKLGIYNTAAPTAIDYRIGNPTNSHRHDGASGQGMKVNPTSIPAPSGAVASALSLHDHLMDITRHTGSPITIVPFYHYGSVPSGASLGIPFSFGRTMQLLSADVRLKTAPSGATFALDVNFGATSVWVASQGIRPILPAGSAYVGNASPNLITYPSGALITVDADKVGTSDPGQDLSLMLVFRE